MPPFCVERGDRARLDRRARHARAAAQVAVGGEPASEAENRATAVDPRTGRILATLATGLRPPAIAFTPDGTRGYVTDEGDASITIIDAKARRWAGRIELAGGHHAYVTTGRAGQLVAIDLERNVVVRSVAAGARPWRVAIGPSNDVAVIDPDAGKVIATIQAGRDALRVPAALIPLPHART